MSDIERVLGWEVGLVLDTSIVQASLDDLLGEDDGEGLGGLVGETFYVLTRPEARWDTEGRVVLQVGIPMRANGSLARVGQRDAHGYVNCGQHVLTEYKAKSGRLTFSALPFNGYDLDTAVPYTPKRREVKKLTDVIHDILLRATHPLTREQINSALACHLSFRDCPSQVAAIEATQTLVSEGRVQRHGRGVVGNRYTWWATENGESTHVAKR